MSKYVSVKDYKPTVINIRPMNHAIIYELKDSDGRRNSYFIYPENNKKSFRINLNFKNFMIEKYNIDI